MDEMKDEGRRTKDEGRITNYEMRRWKTGNGSELWESCSEK
ncbi:hypothetical protein [Chryseobacterium suipulveris]|nr:hypothetical protein [Chryseobacterium suipulveris]